MVSKRICAIIISLVPIHGMHADVHPFVEIARAYVKQEQFDDAIDLYKQLLSTDTGNFELFFELGCCYLNCGKIDKAIIVFDHIIHYAPQAINAYYNKGYALKTAGQLSQAIEIYTDIIYNHPHFEPAQLALGFAYLSSGDFEKGWKQHERYLQRSGKNAEKLRELLKNNTLAGKIIILSPEGGLGDTLQFIRYAQRLQEMGAHIIAAVQKPLIPLLSRCSYIDQIIPTDSRASVTCDAHASLMSLPAVFADTESTFPQIVPYIFPDPVLIQRWKERLSSDHRFKIGICWQADVHNDESRLAIARRGIPLSQFFCLNTYDTVSLYSLQKYDGVDQLANMPAEFILTCFEDFDETSGPFMDTAALMCNLDLIITVDTAVAHLAGALGRSVWLLLPYSTDWRWIVGRTDSPWYPTMRIFKQEKPFDWDSVMEKVQRELQLIQKRTT